MEAAVLYSLPMSAVASASAVGWLMAYLGAPDIVHRWIEAVSGDNRIVIMYLMVVVLTIAGDFLDGVPAIAIFMPIIVSLSQLGHIHPVHMGVLIIVSLAFGAGHALQGWDASIATGLLGLTWGWLYLRRRSAVAPIVSHAGFDLLQVLPFLGLR